jgi:capsid protein
VPFLQAVIAIALKSLDIPYSFYDESFTNFFGSRAAWQHYERSCKDKRARILEFLQWWTQWELMRDVLAGKVKLPAGLTIADEFWEWVPDGMPWWDPVKEINGDNMAIQGGFTSPQKVVKQRGGGDFYDNVDAIADANEYARKKGIVLSYDLFAPPVEVVEKDE